MRRRTAASVVAAGTLATVAVGSGITAWASWQVGSANGRGTLPAASVPTMAEPDVTATTRVPRVAWTAVRFASGHLVGGYVVTRRTGKAEAEACRAPASVFTCTDAGAVPGSEVTYTVRAVAGTRWSGPESPSTGRIRVPGRIGGNGPAGTTGGKTGGKTGGNDRRADVTVPEATTPAPPVSPTGPPAPSVPPVASVPSTPSVSPSAVVTSGTVVTSSG